ncbi:MAG TPA: hypothetical protein VFJ58_20715 [Armatimonadota bacterium]|nr:hypothetical protein [Armatimonadota bacterium]
MPLDWRTAFLRQAKSDYKIYEILLGLDDVPRCQQLHYLQMSTEKLAKGFLSLPGGGPPPRSHNALVRFMQVAAVHREIRTANHYAASHSAFREYVQGLLPKAREVENLSPEGPDHPNPEYPWNDLAVDVVSPLDHDFAGLDPKRSGEMWCLLSFLRNCFELPELRRM